MGKKNGEKAKVEETQISAEDSGTIAAKEDVKDNSAEIIADLNKKLEEAKELADKEKDDYVRLMAEFETFRRRTAEDRLNLIASASAETIEGLLPVLDDCERAIAILKDSSDEAAKEGTSLIYNKLLGYLKTKGLEPIKAKGEKFDTDLHEAVAQFPVQDEALKGLVYDVALTGYKLNDKVLRFAKVVVGV